MPSDWLPGMTFQSASYSAVEDPQKTGKMFWMVHNQRLEGFPVDRKKTFIFKTCLIAYYKG